MCGETLQLLRLNELDCQGWNVGKTIQDPLDPGCVLQEPGLMLVALGRTSNRSFLLFL